MRIAVAAFVLAGTLGALLPPPAPAEQASQPGSPAAARLDAGRNHTCAVLSGGSVRCWGFSREGELGRPGAATIGDDETPGSVGPVDLGAGRTATAISAGDYHTCALLDDATVRCWGFGREGRLGTGNEVNVGDDETPGSVPPVRLGAGRTARAISAGGAHTCALLDDGAVRCWGYGFDGRLGYGDGVNVGDNEPPDAVAPVDLGAGRAAKAISAGDYHVCALLDDATVRCWGLGRNGQLGYGNGASVGDDERPGSVGPVDLGPGRGATAISAGGAQTCALLDDATARCWGFGRDGRLGYGSSASVGDDETPAAAGPVDLGPGRRTAAISVGDGSVCARLVDSSVRCWGFGGDGRLGYGNLANVGDDETPAAAGPVDLGGGQGAGAVSVGGRHSCARLDSGGVRCWGHGGNGRLGYCNEFDVGDDESPGTAGPVDLGDLGGPPGSSCAGARAGGGGWAPAAAGGVAPDSAAVDPLAAEGRRARGLRACLRRAGRRAERARRRARHACRRRHGRTPGRVTGLRARADTTRQVELGFDAPASDGARGPAARTYLVKQSRRPIRTAREFSRAQTLCGGRCRFPTVTQVGAQLTLTVTDLRPGTTYHFAVAARDNVSRRLGPRSDTVTVRTVRPGRASGVPNPPGR